MMRASRGFSFVEMIIALAITGFAAAIVGTGAYNFYGASQFGDTRVAALHELQNAGYWFNRDGQAAVSATGGASLTLTMPSGGGTVTYTLSGNSMQRSDGTTTTSVARSITALSFTVSGQLVTMNITSSPLGRFDVSQQGTYEVYMRSMP